jgi:hypothetical protein
MQKKMEGWIKLHRKLLDWEWYDEPNTLRLFLHLLLKANHKPKKYRGVDIKQGQVMTGYDRLANELGLSTQQIRTAINKLKLTNEITSVSNSQGTIIQIVKYKDYQVVTSKSTDKSTDEQQTSNKRITTNKKDNKEKERKEDNNVVVDFQWLDVENYFYKQAKDNKLDSAQLLKKVAWAFEYYKELGFKNSKGKQIKNLNSTIKNNWIKDYDDYLLVKPFKKPTIAL